MIFWDVDTQVDFMHADGKLYVPGAETIIPNLKRLTDYAHDHGIRIVASADDHVSGHRELSDQPDFRATFPLHCMRGTPGQEKIGETALRDAMVIEPEAQDAARLSKQLAAHPGDVLLHKHWFDVFTNQNTDTMIGALKPRTVVLYGVATDVCNKYALEGLMARHPELRLFAVQDAMKAIDPGAQDHLLKQWGEQGVRVVNTDEITEDGIPA
ncbi:MAG TPA: cysteine hydrolase family protein [Gemmatimonadales bacterium]